MSKCKKCNINILDNTDRCPFCSSVIEVENGKKASYPDARVNIKNFRLASNIFLFVSIVTALLQVFIDFNNGYKFSWSVIGVLCLIYLNVILRLSIAGKSDYQFKIFSLTTSTVVVLFLIDFLTGNRGWALNYVAPSAIIGVDIVILILMITNHRNWQSYIVPQMFMVVLSLLPLIFWIFGMIYAARFAVITMLITLFELLGTIIIGDKRARTEIKRRFHI